MSTTIEPAELLAGLATFAASEHLHVGKDGYNEHFSFNYATEPGLFAAARAALSEAGLSATMSFEQGSHEIITVFDRDGNERPAILATVAARLTIRDQQGNSVECLAYGMGIDPSDKAMAKAETQASKVVTQKALMIEVESDDTDAGNPGSVGRARNGSSGGAASDKQLGYLCAMVKKVLATEHGDTEPMALRLARMGGDPATEFKAISKAGASELIEKLKKVESNPEAGSVILDRLAAYEAEHTDTAAAGQPDVNVPADDVHTPREGDIPFGEE